MMIASNYSMTEVLGRIAGAWAHPRLAAVPRSGDNGTYYDETRPADPNPLARDPGVQQRLLDVTRARLAAAGIRVGPGTTGR